MAGGGLCGWRGALCLCLACVVVCGWWRCGQAVATWQWANYLHAHVPSGKRALLVNFDETAVCAFQGDGKGNVFLGRGAIQRVSCGKRRTYLSYVAFICDDPLLQPCLPQVVVANERTLTARDILLLHESCPLNVRVLRQKSAWVDKELCNKMVRWLADALAPYTSEVQPIVLFDACRSHVARTAPWAERRGEGG